MLLITKNKKSFVLLFVIVVLFFSVLLLRTGGNCSPDKSFLQAAKYFQNWQMNKAETLLTSLVKESPINSKTANLYLQTLINLGEINKAQQFVWKYNSNKYFNSPSIILKKAFIYFYLGKIDSSLIEVNSALAIGTNIADNTIISQANNLKGRLQFYKADYDSALIFQKRALKTASKFNLKNEQANALRQLGVLYWYKGKLDSALSSFYTPALKIYREVNNKIGEATTLSNIGLLYFNWKDWKQKFAYNIKALSIRKSIGDKIGLSDSYYFLANLPLFNKKIETTKLKLLKKSYELSNRIGYAWGKEVSGRTLELNRTLNYDKGIDIGKIDSMNYNSGEGKMFALLRKSYSNNYNENLDSLTKIYKALTEYSDSLNYEVFKFSFLCNYCALLIKQNKLAEAELAAERALKLTFSITKRKYDFHFLKLLLAKIDYKKGNLNKTLSILNNLTQYYDSLYVNALNDNPSIMGYESAILETYNLRSSAYALLLDVLYSLKKYELFYQTVELQRKLSLWRTPKSMSENSGYSHSNFASSLLIYINSKENNFAKEKTLLKDFDRIISNKVVQRQTIIGFSKSISKTLPVKLMQFQESIGNNSVFLEYAFGSSSLYCLIITKKSFSVEKINIDENYLVQLVVFFKNAILRGKWTKEDKLWEAPALNLYKTLLGNMNKNGILDKHKNVIISPARILNQLPFSALLKSNSNNNANYLIQNNVLSFTSSINDYYWKHILPESKVNSLLAVAPNTRNLYYSENEISDIPNKLFKTKKVLIGKEATLANFLQNILTFDVIHFAGHASVNMTNPFYSRLHFNDTSLKLYEILKYRIAAKLVILNACESGVRMSTVNDLPIGNDVVSFPRAWVTAGAGAVLSSQWLVEDYSASILIKNFYKNLLDNKYVNKLYYPRALNSAQLNFINARQNKQYSHPFYWAELYLTY